MALSKVAVKVKVHVRSTRKTGHAVWGHLAPMIKSSSDPNTDLRTMTGIMHDWKTTILRVRWKDCHSVLTKNKITNNLRLN